MAKLTPKRVVEIVDGEEVEMKPLGFVYFLQAQHPEGLIKIGYSLLNPDERHRVCDIASPVPLAKMALMRGRQSDEQGLHDRFRKSWVKGEWFRPDPALLDYIRSNARDWDELSRECYDERLANRFDPAYRGKGGRPRKHPKRVHPFILDAEPMP